MEPTPQDLAYAVYCLGSQEMPSEEIPQQVLDRLVEFNMVHVEVDSPPVLTEYGRKAYSRITSANGSEIPEFSTENSRL
jgi:hypothetical protein